MKFNNFHFEGNCKFVSFISSVGRFHVDPKITKFEGITDFWYGVIKRAFCDAFEDTIFFTKSDYESLER